MLNEPHLATTSRSCLLIIFNSHAIGLPLTSASARPCFRVKSSRLSLNFVAFYSYSKKRSMPPKKQVEEKKILLGRPGNSLKR